MKLTTDMIIDDEYIMFGDKVTRFEVVDNKGRAYVKHRVQELKFQLQDDGRTLKAFVRFEEEEEISID